MWSIYSCVKQANWVFILFLGVVLDSYVCSQCNGRRGRSYVATSKADMERPCVYVLEFNQVRLTTPQIADKYGLKVEKHQVTTQDGYELELHRLPNPGKPVVLLVHGLFQSSRDFFINCDRRALAIRLADEKMDVWVMNLRGSTYSLKHANLSTDELEYWDYSIDNIIQDAEFVVDYVLGATKQPRLSWVGYSMGNAVMIGLLATKPEYNDKIEVGFVLGGAPQFSHTKTPYVRLIAPFSGLIEKMITRFNHGEFLPRYLIPIMHRLFPLMCLPEARSRRSGLCALSLYLNDGYNPHSVDPRVYTTMLGGFPTSISVRSYTQWMQWIINGKFAYYDYGALRNMRKYGQAKPPLYSLKKATAPLVHFYGENDFFIAPRDAQASEKVFPSIQMIKIPNVSWNHIDFLFGGDADIYIYNKIVNIVNERNNLTCQNFI